MVPNIDHYLVQFAEDVEMIALDAAGTTTAMTKVVRGEYDATVQDDIYYMQEESRRSP